MIKKKKKKNFQINLNPTILKKWLKSCLIPIITQVKYNVAYPNTMQESYWKWGRLMTLMAQFFFFYFILFLNFTILYWFCQISKWIRHRYTRFPHPEPSSLLPPHTIPLSRPSAPAPSIQYCASNLDWRLFSYMILYMFQCHSPKLSHPLPLPQSPKDCSIHQCLFCCFFNYLLVKAIW